MSRLFIFRLAGCSCLLALLLGASLGVQAQWVPLNPVKGAETQADGVTIELQNGFLRFQVCTESIVHVVYSLESALPQRQEFLIVK